MADARINLITKYVGEGVKKAGQALSSLNREAEKVGLGYQQIAQAGIDFVKNSVLAAAEGQAVANSFVNLSGGASKATEMMGALNRATLGLVSETGQQRIANQLMGMQIANTGAEMEAAVGISRRLGATFKNLGAEDAANEFALLISNMSFARLDSFGISAGKVRKRVAELMATTAGMTKEQAFFQATMEEGEEVIKRLGPETFTVAQEMQGLQASTEDFQGAFGELISDGGVINWLDTMVDKLTEGAKAWSGVLTEIERIDEAMDRQLNDRLEADLAAEGKWGFIGRSQRQRAIRLTLTNEQLAESYTEVVEEEEAAAAAADALIQANEDLTDSVVELTDEERKLLDQRAKARTSFARELIDIEESTAEDIEETWSDYFTAESKAWEDSQKRIVDIKKDAAKDIEKIDKDLQKDLAREAKKLSKSLADIDKQEARDIKKVQEATAKETRNNAKRKQIDALADERLFNFELRQLAAEGESNQILALIERRAIEEEIAREKAAVEGQIEAESQADEIARIREAANERRAELRLDSNERVNILKEEAAEEKAEREQRLAETLEAEAESYQERVEELRVYRQTKLNEIESSKQEAIQALAREMAEIGTLTATQLRALAPVAGQLGEDAGRSFAEGLERGFSTNSRINRMIGGLNQALGGGGGGRGNNFSGNANPATLGQFAEGGIVPGPIGSPQLAVVHGGETITPPGQGGINVNINGFGGAELAQIIERKVNEGLQEYTDTVMVPLMS